MMMLRTWYEGRRVSPGREPVSMLFQVSPMGSGLSYECRTGMSYECRTRPFLILSQVSLRWKNFHLDDQGGALIRSVLQM